MNIHFRSLQRSVERPNTGWKSHNNCGISFSHTNLPRLEILWFLTNLYIVEYRLFSTTTKLGLDSFFLVFFFGRFVFWESDMSQNVDKASRFQSWFVYRRNGPQFIRWLLRKSSIITKRNYRLWWRITVSWKHDIYQEKITVSGNKRRSCDRRKSVSSHSFLPHAFVLALF